MIYLLYIYIYIYKQSVRTKIIIIKKHYITLNYIYILVHWCFPEAMGIVHTLPMETSIVFGPSMFTRVNDNCSPPMSVMSIKVLGISCILPMELPMDYKFQSMCN